MKKKYPNWYQARIFIKPNGESDNSYNWSLRIYGDIIKKFVEEFPKVRFWFTKYQTTLEYDKEYSTGLPPSFVDGKSYVRSVRFRVRLTNKKQYDFLNGLLKQQENQLDPDYWIEGIKKYDHYTDLCGERFKEWFPFGKDKRGKISERKRRGDLVQKALEYNCRLILDCLVLMDFESTGRVWSIEKNINPNNTAWGNVSRSMMHLYVNPWSDSKCSPLPIYGIDWSAIFYI